MGPMTIPVTSTALIQIKLEHYSTEDSTGLGKSSHLNFINSSSELR